MNLGQRRASSRHLILGGEFSARGSSQVPLRWETKWCASPLIHDFIFPLASNLHLPKPFLTTMNSLHFPIAAFGIGGSELLLILAIVVLLFGGAKLPELARGLGKSIKEFKKASADGEADSADSAEKKAAVKPEATKTHGSN